MPVNINPPPYVSIILPVRNEESAIRKTLQSVFSQDYPAELLQVIVADGMSDDGTRQILREYQAIHPNLIFIDNPARIVPTGMNLAIARAKGEIIIRVDGHCEIPKDYVSNCVRHLQNDRVDGVGGSVETIGEGRLAEAIAVAMSTPFGVGGTAFRTTQGQNVFADTIPFPAYKRSAILRAGRYDEELVRNQDDEYNYRLRKLGAKLLLAADIHSKYYSRGSLRSLQRQYYQYGYWKVRVLQKHPRQMSLRQFVPPAFVFSLLSLGLLSLFADSARRALALVAAAYLLTNLAASIWTARSKGWKRLPYLPVVYATLHLSYGLGFLVGLVKFAGRWNDKVGKTPAFEDILAQGEHDRAG